MTITIPDFITHIQTAKAQRPKYIYKGDVRPEYAREFIHWNKKGQLLDWRGNPALKNPKTANRPTYKKINGNAVYSGMHHALRAKTVRLMKESYKPHLENLLSYAGRFPVDITMEIHQKLRKKEDIDNKWIYSKTFLDALVDNHILPDDTIRTVRSIKMVGVHAEHNKLVIHIES